MTDVERKKLYYTFTKSITTVKNKYRYEDEIEDEDYINEWIANSLCSLTKLNDHELDIVLTILYSNFLNELSLENVTFILSNPKALEKVFFKEGKFINSKSKMLSVPYLNLIQISPVIAEYCFSNDIEILDDCVTALFKYQNNVSTIENLILCNNKNTNAELISSLMLFFMLKSDCPDFINNLDDLPQLYTASLALYEKINFKDDITKDLLCFYSFLFNNRFDEKFILKVIDFIEKDEFETIDDVLDLEFDDLAKYMKEYNVNLTGHKLDQVKNLYRKNPKVAKKLIELYSKNKIHNFERKLLYLISNFSINIDLIELFEEFIEE